MHKYLPHTAKDIEQMLAVSKVGTIDDLFVSIPKALRLKKPYNIPSVLSDDNLTTHMKALASKNKELVIFRGAGSYDHYTPSVVNSLINRQEFLTSYTPYQPEVAQGTLQYIFEYQSMICELTGMEVSNASMYDGATSTAEAMFMAKAQTGKNMILISETVNPRIIEVVETYAKYRDIKVLVVPQKKNVTDLNFVKENVVDAMGLIVQNPNYFGAIENYEGFADVVHAHDGMLIMNAEGNP